MVQAGDWGSGGGVMAQVRPHAADQRAGWAGAGAPHGGPRGGLRVQGGAAPAAAPRKGGGGRAAGERGQGRLAAGSSVNLQLIAKRGGKKGGALRGAELAGRRGGAALRARNLAGVLGESAGDIKDGCGCEVGGTGHFVFRGQGRQAYGWGARAHAVMTVAARGRRLRRRQPGSCHAPCGASTVHARRRRPEAPQGRLKGACQGQSRTWVVT